MKLIPFAKIFETEVGQTLAVKCYDAETDKFGIKISVATEDLDGSATLYYNTIEARDATFDELTMDQITALAKGLLDTLTQVAPEPENDDFKNMLLQDREDLQKLMEESDDFPDFHESDVN